MNSKIYNIIMGIATALAWLGFFIIISNFDPRQATWVVFLLFYMTLGLGVLGLLSLLGFWIRRLFNPKKIQIRLAVVSSLRQGLIMAAVVVIGMFLQSARILTWWNMLLLIIAATSLEFVLLLFHHKQKEDLVHKA